MNTEARPTSSQVESLSGAGGTTQIVKIEGDGLRAVSNFFVAMIVALCISLPMSAFAVVMTIVQVERVNDLDRDARLEAYWLQRVETILQEKGIPVPPDPTMRKKP